MALPLWEHRLLFVTGKGGVGKTAVAAALAQVAARREKRVLLSDMDGRGDLAAAFGLGRLTFEPIRVADGLHVMSMDTEASLAEYLRLQMRVPLVRRLGPVAAAFDFVANAAPGVREILRVGKFAHEVREDHYDLVVVDSPASGHIVGHLAAAEAIGDVVKLGPVRAQTAWMTAMLSDPAITGTVVVSTPEELPVTELEQLTSRLAAETDVDLAAIVANRVPDRPEPPRPGDGDDADPGMAAVLDAADFLTERHLQAVEQLDVLTLLAERTSTPLVCIPDFPETDAGELVEAMAGRFSEVGP